MISGDTSVKQQLPTQTGPDAGVLSVSITRPGRSGVHWKPKGAAAERAGPIVTIPGGTSLKQQLPLPSQREPEASRTSVSAFEL